MTTFTKALAAVNFLDAVVSIALFIATWFSQGLIVATAKDYALLQGPGPYLKFSAT
jgi:hypothetical protein